MIPFELTITSLFKHQDKTLKFKYLILEHVLNRKKKRRKKWFWTKINKHYTHYDESSSIHYARPLDQ